MRQRLLILFLGSLLSMRVSYAQTQLQQESFETNGEGTRYTSTAFDRREESPTPYTAQYFLREDNPVQYNGGTYSFGTNASPTTIGNVTGTFFWASEGARGQTTTAPDRPAQTVKLNPVSITGYTNLQVKVAMADGRGAGAPLASKQWENSDYVRVKVRVNGGAWQTIGQFVGDDAGGSIAGNLRQDLNLNGTSYDNTSAPIVTATLQDFTFSVSGSGSTLEAMVEVDQIGGTEEFAFDNIRVLGTASATSPPALANIEGTDLNYNEGNAATIITNTITASDPDNTVLTGAVVTLSTGFVQSQDVLSFTPGNGISGTYNSSAGTLTLSGTASLANYQTALRSVKYQNSNTITAIGGTRLVTFIVSDGTNTSNGATRNINVVAQLNAPASLPYTEDFDPNGEGLRYASNTWSTTAPCLGFLSTNVNPYPCSPATFSNISNSYYWYAEGTSNGANPNTVDIGTLVLAPVNATTYNNLHFNIRLGTGQAAQWESDDYVKIFYRINAGSWVQFGAFFGNGTLSAPGELQRDTDLDGVANAGATILGPALQNIDFALPASVSGASVDFMIEVNSDGQEELAMDRIVVTGSPIVVPTVTTTASGNVLTTSALLGGNVTSNGGATDTERGVVYSPTNTTPTTSNTKVQIGTGAGIFSQTITGLTAGTLYYVRAYATNPAGTSYGSTVTFTTTPNPPMVSNPVNGTLTNNTVPIYAGTAQATSLVTIYVDGSSIGSTTATSGNWSLSQPTTLATGSHTVYARALIGSSAASANSNTNTFTIDAIAPTVSSVNVPANGAYRTGLPLSFTVNFSENVTVTGTPQLTLTIGSTNRQANFVSGSGTSQLVFTYTVQTGELDTDGIALASVLTLNGGTIRDAATNNATLTLNGVGSTIGIKVDAVAPTVSISSSAGASGSTTSTSPIPVTLTFSESVTGLIASEVTVTGGTIAGFSSNSTTTTFNVMPSASGLITINVAANVAQDAAGNGNSAATTFSITYQSAPIITSFTAVNGSICAGQVVGFTATLGNVGSGYTYTLSDGVNAISGSGTGTAFSQSLVVNTPGPRSFTLAIVSSGQSASVTTSVTVGAQPTNPSLTGGTLTCAQTSLTLTASATGASSYSFRAGASQIGNTNQAIVSQSGTYTVIISSAAGCTIAQTTTVLSNTTVPTVSLSASGTLTCSQNSVTLTAGDGATYQFNGPGIMSVSGNQAVVNVGGTYSVTTTGTNGCSATQTTIVQSNTTGQMITVKAGNWNDTSVWSCGRVPLSTDPVTINHAVTLPVSYQGQALRVIYSSTGQLLFGTSSRLLLGSN